MSKPDLGICLSLIQSLGLNLVPRMLSRMLPDIEVLWGLWGAGWHLGIQGTLA